MYTDATELLINKQNIQNAQQILDYNISREIFLKQNLPKLKNKLLTTRNYI